MGPSAAAGQRLIDAAEQGPAVLGELIARHGIDCGYAVPGIIMAAHTEKALSAHEKRVDYWQARGRPVELLDRRQAADMIGSDHYLRAPIHPGRPEQSARPWAPPRPRGDQS